MPKRKSSIDWNDIRHGDIMAVLKKIEEAGKRDIGFFARDDFADLLKGLVKITLTRKEPIIDHIPYTNLLELLESEKRDKGKHIVAPETLKALFGFDIKETDTPPISAHPWLLKRLADPKLLHCFFYYWPEDGWTMEKIYKKLIPCYEKESWGKVLFDTKWYGTVRKEEAFFVNEPIPVGWRCFSRLPILETDSKNALQETELLIKWVCDQLYAGKALPFIIRKAKSEFDNIQERITTLISGNEWAKGAEELSKLSINKLFCPTEAEQLLASALVRAQMSTNIFNGCWGRSRSLSSDGGLVSFGFSDSLGARVDDWLPHVAHGHIERFFSCSF